MNLNGARLPANVSASTSPLSSLSSLSSSRLIALALFLLTLTSSSAAAALPLEPQDSMTSLRTRYLSCSSLSLPLCRSNLECRNSAYDIGFDTGCGPITCELKTGTCVYQMTDSMCVREPVTMLEAYDEGVVQEKCLYDWDSPECVYRWCIRKATKTTTTTKATTTTTTTSTTYYPQPSYAKRCADYSIVEPNPLPSVLPTDPPNLYDYCTVSPDTETDKNFCCDPSLRPACNDLYDYGPRCCFQTGEWSCPGYSTRGVAYCHISGPIAEDYLLGSVWATQGPFGLPCGTLEVGILNLAVGHAGDAATIVYLGSGNIGLGSDVGTVYFNSKRCDIASWTPLEVTVHIPADATPGVDNLVLIRKDGEVAQALEFRVL